MFTIGCHLSSSKGYLVMGETATKIGANTFQFFTRNPRGGSVKSLDLVDIAKYNAYAKENGIGQLLAHAPYTMNLCSADADLRIFAKNIMLEDLSRLEHLDNVQFNFHPGSHVKQGVDVGTGYIIETLKEALAVGGKTPILLETMAGKGSEIGRNFEELKAIIDGVENHPRMGVCLDTCHVFDGGYDIVGDLDGVLAEFDRIIGLERLKAIHLNDSKNPFASHKDRHEKIGAGSLGLEAITKIINHKSLKDLPFYLETPNELDGYMEEIKLLHSLRKDG
ncbi:deoxyribonuclease IV [Chakrabartyella piscis]|uniref:deoxyribonuclease IV n=1 Tax=Chakrabartyella piscis TaxID=2918914 RepID=UPI0029588153|nr:deoxyribonuclease IV [Chakrabartyella piscis]